MKLLESKGIEYLPEDAGDTTKILGSSKNFEMTEAGKMALRQTSPAKQPIPAITSLQPPPPSQQQQQKKKLIVTTVPASRANSTSGGKSTVTIVPASAAMTTGTRQPLVVRRTATAADQQQQALQVVSAAGREGGLGSVAGTTTRVIRVAAKGAGAGSAQGPILVRTVKSPVKRVAAAGAKVDGSAPATKLIRIGNKLLQGEERKGLLVLGHYLKKHVEALAMS